MRKKEVEIFYPTNQTELRKWLKQNHDSKQSVWLVCFKKESNKPIIAWKDAVDEALILRR
jgi:uncharacterized protein YdeI (YjbR/CyaY-like superfamily)